MVTPVAKRQAVAHLCQTYEVSQRRACQVIGADRSSVRYLSARPDDAVVRSRLRELASVRRRFGYRRLLLMLRGEGVADEPQEAEAAVCARSGFRCAGVADAKERWEQGLH